MLLVLDNYDSFTYNLTHYLEHLGARYEVIRNDEIDVASLEKYSSIVLSPGPGLPKESGALMPVIQAAYGNVKMLGVCLGLQGILEHLGTQLRNLDTVLHGVQTEVSIDPTGQLFSGFAESIAVGRYHSWSVRRDELPENVRCTAWDNVNDVMAFEIAAQKAYGVQFHPESIMTPRGKTILKNWLEIV